MVLVRGLTMFLFSMKRVRGRGFRWVLMVKRVFCFVFGSLLLGEEGPLSLSGMRGRDEDP